MGNGGRSCIRRWSWALLAAGALALAGACGNDDGGDDDTDEPEGERCSSPGQTDNTCRCSSTQPMGYRQCTDDGIWTACTCAPARDAGDNDCRYEGQKVRCWPCPGETVGRETTCLQDRTFDCSCRDGGSSSTRDGG
jgi:hypothetical protein